MPELPDVEVYRRTIARTALHKPIAHVHADDRIVLGKGTTLQKLASRLHGRSFERTRRRGKYAGIDISDGECVVLHFGMTGDVELVGEDDDLPESTRVEFEFEDGDTLAFLNQRKLGRVSIHDGFDSFVEEKGLGPDALDIDESEFAELIEGKRSGLKAFLMDQQTICGVGNVYSDEIMFQAGLSPHRQTSDVSEKERRTLHSTMRRVLETAIKKRADPAKMPDGWLTRVRRDDDAECPKCGGKIRNETVNGRTARWCPGCQT